MCGFSASLQLHLSTVILIKIRKLLIPWKLALHFLLNEFASFLFHMLSSLFASLFSYPVLFSYFSCFSCVKPFIFASWYSVYLSHVLPSSILFILNNVTITCLNFFLVFCFLTQSNPLRLATWYPRSGCWLGWGLG